MARVSDVKRFRVMSACPKRKPGHKGHKGRKGCMSHLCADANGNVVKEGLCKLFLERLDLRDVEVGAQKAHAAVDVKPDATCG